MLAQFESSAASKVKIDEAQVPLLEELKGVKAEIEDFDAMQRQFVVSLPNEHVVCRIELTRSLFTGKDRGSR